jgi:putative ABC transport system substrate-binding protein
MELVPVAAKIGFLYDASAATGAAQRAAAEAAASALGIAIVFGAVQSVETVGAGAQSLVDQGVNVIVYGDGLSAGLDQMLEVAKTARIPVVYPSLASVLRGGLVILGVNNDLTFHAAAALVDQILKGANPAAVPFVEIDAGWLAVNLAAAAEIGFTFPPAVLERANQVIE